MRHGGVHLSAAARRNRLHPDREIREGAGDPRAQPAHCAALRSVPQRAVPDADHRTALGRRGVAMDRIHRPRRSLHRAIRLHGQRSAQPAEAAGSSRRQFVQRTLVPHQPLGLRVHRRRQLRQSDRVERQACRHHRHRRDRRAVRTARRRQREAHVSVPTYAIVDRRAREPPNRSRLGEVVRVRLAAPPHGEFLHADQRRLRGRRSGDGRLDRDHRQAVARPRTEHRSRVDHAHARDGRLRKDGAGARAGRSNRQRSEHRGSAEALLPPVLQAAVFPRRISAIPSIGRT